MRLERWVAERTGRSRKEAREAVRRGRVTVQGACVRDPAHAVGAQDRVAIDGVEPPPLLELAVLHKPVGVQCTVGDPRGRPSLAETARELLAGGLHPVGRLDADSEGLVPFARDGALTQRLLHPRHAVEKVYAATVEGTPPADLEGLLAAGVATAEGTHVGRLIAVDGALVTLAVTEGKHRMVRRMLANLGLPVVRLVRLRFGALELGALPAGTWRPATADEQAWARGLLGGRQS